MNRTGIFLASAAMLALVALVAGVPHFTRPDGTVVQPPKPKTNGAGSLTMTSRLSHPFITVGRQDVFATVDLNAVAVPGQARGPVNLALVIDRSGSMSGFKLNQAKQAARQLVSQLNASDRLAIVHYGSDVKSLDGMSASPDNKERMLSFIDGIYDDGGTNIGAGLTTGRDLLLAGRGDYRVNRIVLISDGQPTEGVVEFESLTSIVHDIRAQGVSVSSIGVGDDFNERLMEAFAEVGAGAYAYLQDAAQLAAIFEKDLNAAGTQVARQVTLTFRVPKGAQLQRVLGYTQVSRHFDGETELVTVAMPDFAASQHERLVAHFTVDGLAANQTVDVSSLDLSYTDVLSQDGRGVRDEARLSAMTTDQPSVVMDNRDKDAIVFAARARAADNAQKAADLVGQGQTEAAEQLIRSNQVFFDEAAAVAGEGAMVDDYKNMKQAIGGLESVKRGAPAPAAQKTIRTQARRDFGLMGSTY